MSDKNEQRVLQDTDTIKHVIIRIDLENNSTRIMSGLSLWGNIKMFASGIGVSYRKLLEDGENPISTYKQLEKVIIEMLDTDYDIENSDEKTNKNGGITGRSDSKTESVATKSHEAKRVVNNKQPIGKDDHKQEKKDQKPNRIKNKNKKTN